jgi:glutathione S-transferase
LLLDFLEIAHEKQAVDFFPGLEHKSDAFLRINPLGQIPVLEDDGAHIRDAQAILVYLASRYDPDNTWWPVNDPAQLGRVAQWLAFADSITSTASAARLHDVLGYDLDVEQARAGAHRLFRILDDHLANQELQGFDWIAGPNATVADIACFPYTALAGDGGIDLFYYPAIQRWIRRFVHLPHFKLMPGINIFA